jgi:hypothetical protein
MQIGDTSAYNFGRIGYPVPQPQGGMYGSQQPSSYGFQPRLFNVKAFKIFGGILAVLAAITLSLAIANVVMTISSFCTPWMSEAPQYCSTTGEPYIWTWVAVGIWASIPIFIAGISAMCIGSNPEKWTKIFALCIFLSAVVFAPAIIILSAIEVWRGWAANWNFYMMDGLEVEPGSITAADDAAHTIKFVLPLIIAILGAIMFIMTLAITVALCCCMQWLGIYMPGEFDNADQQGDLTTAAVQPYPARPQVAYSYDVDYSPGRPTGPHSRFSSSLPYMPHRYSSGDQGIYDRGVVAHGHYPSRVDPPGQSSFAADFFKPNPAYFWK